MKIWHLLLTHWQPSENYEAEIQGETSKFEEKRQQTETLAATELNFYL